MPDFEGVWQVSRTIADARGPDGRFAGTATLLPNAEGLRYTETGQLTLGEASFTAERSYQWSVAGPNQIAIAFADGRPFHQFDLSRTPNALHDCPPDIYRVHYDFSPWPSWTCVWRVTGPRKDYEMTSTYSRLGVDP